MLAFTEAFSNPRQSRQKRPCEQRTELIISYGNKVWPKQAGVKMI